MTIFFFFFFRRRINTNLASSNPIILWNFFPITFTVLGWSLFKELLTISFKTSNVLIKYICVADSGDVPFVLKFNPGGGKVSLSFAISSKIEIFIIGSMISTITSSWQRQQWEIIFNLLSNEIWKWCILCSALAVHCPLSKNGISKHPPPPNPPLPSVVVVVSINLLWQSLHINRVTLSSSCCDNKKSCVWSSSVLWRVNAIIHAGGVLAQPENSINSFDVPTFRRGGSGGFASVRNQNKKKWTQ